MTRRHKRHGDRSVSKKSEIAVAKAWTDGRVAIRFEIRGSGSGPQSVSVKASTDISVAEARSMAEALILHADAADTKVAKKAAAAARRQQWREREIVAGRLKIIPWR